MPTKLTAFTTRLSQHSARSCVTESCMPACSLALSSAACCSLCFPASRRAASSRKFATSCSGLTRSFSGNLHTTKYCKTCWTCPSPKFAKGTRSHHTWHVMVCRCSADFRAGARPNSFAIRQMKCKGRTLGSSGNLQSATPGCSGMVRPCAADLQSAKHSAHEPLDSVVEIQQSAVANPIRRDALPRCDPSLAVSANIEK